MFALLETENEENVLVCLRVIIELHKQFRPPYSPDVRIATLYLVLCLYIRMLTMGGYARPLRLCLQDRLGLGGTRLIHDLV